MLSVGKKEWNSPWIKNREYIFGELMRSEDALAITVSQYLSFRYPKAIFHIDTGSGGVWSIGMAVRNKRLNPQNGFPDVLIMEPRRDYHGLCIELKTTNPWLQSGKLRKDKHLVAQSKMLDALMARGYMACFCFGFEQAKLAIDEYFK